MVFGPVFVRIILRRDTDRTRTWIEMIELFRFSPTTDPIMDRQGVKRQRACDVPEHASR